MDTSDRLDEPALNLPGPCADIGSYNYARPTSEHLILTLMERSPSRPGSVGRGGLS